MKCKITIADEVNVKIHNLPVDVRRKIANKLKLFHMQDIFHNINLVDGTERLVSLV